ncbi:MAG: Holliday junction branch migration DNA helicase RuvB [Candidatus Wildermuthbacteria bacterium]|nr:Holliday junction branch migration DNA helicase RuvB [Candidatus Wildermuthbacteria bacterium]MBI2121094.1 Holliday junction branch migration DNA helicase RuvB [Candidatus Wildermuthbacteria bacterium]MBI2647997.1 Holliday junction branch migration DNA helicase RuvB [Candidatus Wildermuthbacteria bacterium]
MFVKSEHDGTEIEEVFEEGLRPRQWGDYVGQESIKQNLSVMIEAAKKRAEPIDHVLFYGSSGLGKTTLAHVIAHELGSHITTCTGPTLERVGDLAAILTNLEEGDVLFIDECHRLKKPIMETLYSAMEDFSLHLISGKGALAHTMDLDLPKFSLIGATTSPASLPSPMRNRFGAIFQFQFYLQHEMEQIIRRSASLMGVSVTPEALSLIASRSRATPRVANRLLRRARDFASIENNGLVSPEVALRTCDSLGIDHHGLEAGDRGLLEILITKFQGGPVGLETLAAALSEESETILDIYEPYLLQLGFLERTPRGRIATHRAYHHLGKSRGLV